MLKKTMKIIISFHSFSEVLKFEKECKNNGIKGRIIPIPREISAGCGMVWSSELDTENELMKIIEVENIEIKSIYKLLK